MAGQEHLTAFELGGLDRHPGQFVPLRLYRMTEIESAAFLSS